MKMKKNDYIVLILIVLILGIFGFFWSKHYSKPGTKIDILMDNQLVYTTSLNDNCILAIKQDGRCARLKTIEEFDGAGNLLAVNNGEANVIQADCPDKICVNMPNINKEDECIVCMPNKLIVIVR